MFDEIAGRYDFLNHLLSAGLDRRWRKRAIRSLALTGSEHVLDLCTGTCDLALEAVSDRRGARRVLGLDFAPRMLDVGAAKLRRHRHGARIALARADAMRIPLADQTMDAVTMAFGIRNVMNATAACAEIHRVLKAGGRFALLEFAVPTTPVLGPVYLWYLRRVLPRIGRLVSKSARAYSYLPASIDAFETPAEVVKILRQIGFVDLTTVPLTFGSVILYTARRRAL